MAAIADDSRLLILDDDVYRVGLPTLAIVEGYLSASAPPRGSMPQLPTFLW